jgi:hypothetical protein
MPGSFSGMGVIGEMPTLRIGKTLLANAEALL